MTVAAAEPARIAERAGYPKLSRCASPIQAVDARPAWSPACLAWRDAEIARLQALPVPERIARVAALRRRMGLAPGEGLGVTMDGQLQPSRPGD